MYTTLHTHNTQLCYNTIIIIKFLRIEDVSCLWRKCFVTIRYGVLAMFFRIFLKLGTRLYFFICFLFFHRWVGQRGAVAARALCQLQSDARGRVTSRPARTSRHSGDLVSCDELFSKWQRTGFMHVRPFSSFSLVYIIILSFDLTWLLLVVNVICYNRNFLTCVNI